MDNHLPKLIVDLALILGAGAVTTLIFKKIKQPLVLGYIIVGFLVGPHFTFVPNVVEKESIKIWAEIGVIFLLFSLGLEFSFKKLINVGGTASITAVIEIIFITTLGYFVGRWMGWNTMNSIFLGGLLASSSTTIILRAFDELGVKRKNYARIVFGVLIVEDIVVILLMVLLSTMAVSQQFNGQEMLFSFFKLIFFLALWFIFGIFLIPTLLRRAKKIIDEETLLILSIGLCLGMVVLATNIGFSAELGAFVMGSILAETTSAEKIEHSLKPVKDLFGAIFFVSIGMLIDPSSMYNYRWEILIVTLLTIFGKLIFTTLGALLSGQPLKQSVQVGMSMAQIGEFAFIVASLGMSLKVTGEFLFPIAVGVSALTTFTTPYMIKYSDNFYKFLNKILPEGLLIAIDKYSKGAQNVQEENKWKTLTKEYASLILTNGTVVVGIVLLIAYLKTFISSQELSLWEADWLEIVALILALLISMPFLWAIWFKKTESKIFQTIWNETKYSNAPLIVLEISRAIVVIILLGFILSMFLPSQIIYLIFIPFIMIGLYLLSTKIDIFYSLIAKKFMFNLNERELKEKKLNENKVPKNNFSLWDSHFADFEIKPNAQYVGIPLSELAWREKYGINIAYIKRGDNVIPIPKENDQLYPFDILGLIGTDAQLKSFEEAIRKQVISERDIKFDEDNITLTKFTVSEPNLGLNESIQTLRKRTHGLVIGIERGENRIPNPSHNTILLLGDVVWIVGEKKDIQKFIQQSEN